MNTRHSINLVPTVSLFALTLSLLLCGQIQAQILFPTEIIYDNSEGDSLNRHSSIDEYGDEVVFDGLSREVVIFQFEYFGEFAPDGDETCIVRIYANDGEGKEGFEKPGTLLYESESFPIFPGFNSVALTDINITVPNRVTWTVDFDGLTGFAEDRAGLLFRDPPTAGLSFDDIWKKRRSGLWIATRFNANPVANFAARFTAKLDEEVSILETEALEDGNVKLLIQTPIDRRLLVEASEDLETWVPVFLGKTESRLLSLIDAREDAGFPRFFRSSLAQDRDINLTGPHFREDGSVALTASGPNGLPFKLQSTTDSINWVDVAEFTFNTREITIVDDDVVPSGFKGYRLILSGRHEPANQGPAEN